MCSGTFGQCITNAPKGNRFSKIYFITFKKFFENKSDDKQIEKISKTLGVKVLPRLLKSKDKSAVIQSILSQWLPLAKSILAMAVEQLPSPLMAQKYKSSILLNPMPPTDDHSLSKFQDIFKDLQACNKEGHAIAFISKMFPSDYSKPLESKISCQGESENANKLIGFARVFSGTLRKGDKVFVMGPKYSPSEPSQHVHQVELRHLFLMMGREAEPVDEVPAGNICGIGGLGDVVLKTATICSSAQIPTFQTMRSNASPIISVAVEPKLASDLPALERGLTLLNYADPCLQILFKETGEHIIIAAGEVHLEMCLKDLREKYAG